MLMSFIVLRQRISKYNANWYAVVIAFNIIWGTIYSIVCNPFNIEVNYSYFDILKHIPIIIYNIGINLLSIILFLKDKAKKRSTWQRYEMLLFVVGCIGGSLGGLISIAIDKRKKNSPHFKFGFSCLLISHVFLFSYLILSNIL